MRRTLNALRSRKVNAITTTRTERTTKTAQTKGNDMINRTTKMMKSLLTLTAAAALALIAVLDIGGHEWTDEEQGRIADNLVVVPGYEVGDEVPYGVYSNYVSNSLRPNSTSNQHALYGAVRAWGDGSHGPKETVFPPHTSPSSQSDGVDRWPADATSSAGAFTYFDFEYQSRVSTAPIVVGEWEISAGLEVKAWAGGDYDEDDNADTWTMKSEVVFLRDSCGFPYDAIEHTPSRKLDEKIAYASGYDYYSDPSEFDDSGLHDGNHRAVGTVWMEGLSTGRLSAHYRSPSYLDLLIDHTLDQGLHRERIEAPIR